MLFDQKTNIEYAPTSPFSTSTTRTASTPVEQNRSVTHTLKNLKCQFYVIKPKTECPIQIVIKGLTKNSNTDLEKVRFQPEKKALDRIWHVRKLYKLIRIQTFPDITKVIQSCLTKRNLAARVNKTYSNYKNKNSGLLQESLLGPTLFNIFENDIPKSRHATICLYADDTAILRQHTEPKRISHFLHRHLAKFKG
ncbi:RNA-directed DNA polymerase from mobile element jockey [Trichonephila clavipes]|nr:RNA-directed DNA polymerase from mobile element jockey [Trichonephila clavipes]